MIAEILQAAGIAGGAYDLIKKRDEYIKSLKRLVFKIKNGEVTLPIFGVGGVGKTTLSHYLTGEDPFLLANPYAESISIDKVKLLEKAVGQIIVAPGQSTRIINQWPELYQLILNNKVKLIINVVAFGYHDFAIDNYKDHSAFENGMNKKQFMENYTNYCKSLEVDGLEILINGLSAQTKPIKILTVIVKQDLWYSQSKSVMEFYQNGAYEKQINRLRMQLGSANFQHEIIPIGLTFSNFKSKSGVELAKTTSGYNFPINLVYRKALLDYLEQFTGVKNG
jgi:ABC-type cobalamin/Fe3+-siderophores transport system ATPase subunit